MTPPRWPLIGFSRRGRPAGAPREGSNRKSRSLTVADAASIDQLSGRSDRYNIGLMGGRALARFMAVAELLLLMVTLLLMKNDEAALHRAHTHIHMIAQTHTLHEQQRTAAKEGSHEEMM